MAQRAIERDSAGGVIYIKNDEPVHSIARLIESGRTSHRESPKTSREESFCQLYTKIFIHQLKRTVSDKPMDHSPCTWQITLRELFNLTHLLPNCLRLYTRMVENNEVVGQKRERRDIAVVWDERRISNGLETAFSLTHSFSKFALVISSRTPHRISIRVSVEELLNGFSSARVFSPRNGHGSN